MSDFRRPEPVYELIEMDQLFFRWNRESYQQSADAHLPLLSPDEQRAIYDQMIDAVHNEQPLLMYVDGRSSEVRYGGHNCRCQSRREDRIM